MPNIPSLAEITEALRSEVPAALDEWGRDLVKQIDEAARPLRFARDYLPHNDAADYIGHSSRVLKDLRRAGKITPVHWSGNVAYYARADLDAYMAGTVGKQEGGEANDA